MSSIKKIVALLVLLSLLFCVAWFAYGKYIETSLIKRSISDYNEKNGAQIKYSSIKMAGFPLKYKFNINDVNASDTDIKLQGNLLVESNLLGRKISISFLDKINFQYGGQNLLANFDKLSATFLTNKLSISSLLKKNKLDFSKADDEKLLLNISNFSLVDNNNKDLVKIDKLDSEILSNYTDNFGTVKFNVNSKNYVITDDFYFLDPEIKSFGFQKLLLDNPIYTEEDKKKLHNNSFEAEGEYKGPLGENAQMKNLSDKTIVFDLKKVKFTSDGLSYDFTAKLKTKIGKVGKQTRFITLPNKTSFTYKLKDFKYDTSMGVAGAKTAFALLSTNFKQINKLKLKHKSNVAITKKLHDMTVKYLQYILDSNDPNMQLAKAFVTKKDIELLIPEFHSNGKNTTNIDVEYSDDSNVKKLDVKNIRSVNEKYGYQIQGKSDISNNMNVNSDLAIELYQYKRLLFGIYKYAKKLAYFGSKFDNKGKQAYRAMSQENFDKLVEFLEYISDEPLKETDKNIKISFKTDSAKNQYQIGRRSMNEVIAYAMNLQSELMQDLGD